jgi:hypothetical protein
MTRFCILTRPDKPADFQPVTDVCSLADRRCEVQVKFQIIETNLD